MPEHLIPVEGGHISAFSQGVGPAVLFLHGWALDQRMWASQLCFAASGFTVITFDRRGFGRSTAPPDINAEVDDICTVLDTVGFESAVVVGMSQGGRVALRFACAYPDRVTKLVLQGAPIDGFPTRPPAGEAIPVEHYRALLRAGDRACFEREWCAHALVAPDLKLMPDAVRPLLNAYEGRDLLHGVPDSYRGDTFGQMKALQVPVLYIYGERDTTWLRSVAETVATVWRDTRAVEIKTAGHFANITRPDAYNAVLAQFLRG
ncbi:alpha/beta fold hydrolase [Kordiimonas sp.]|uniref:alpha/beta fold hydrolase n=1 Tax=Kordiimonas sp. TaxID=1970157 RepID=UPI003A8D9EBD